MNLHPFRMSAAILSRLSQPRVVLLLQLLEVTINRTGHARNKFELLIAGTRGMPEKPEHLSHLIKTLALHAKIYIGVGIRGSGFNIAPQEVAELVHNRPEMLNQTSVQKAIQDVVLILVTGMSKIAPLQLQP